MLPCCARRQCASTPVNGLPPSTARLTPHILLHALCSRHPWPTRLAPAGRTRQSPSSNPKLVCQPGGRILRNVVLPLRRHVDAMPLVSTILRSIRCSRIEVLEIPPIPTRCIHSRSRLDTFGSVMLPFIQCHQTRGRALFGGFRKLCFKGSEWFEVQPMERPEVLQAEVKIPAFRTQSPDLIFIDSASD